MHPDDVGWHTLYKRCPQHVAQCANDLQQFRQSLSMIPVAILGPNDLKPPSRPTSAVDVRMQHFAVTHFLLPKDALLVAIAERLGVLSIATLDGDFKRLGPEFTVYTL